jgi:hypothetical protein
LRKHRTPTVEPSPTNLDMERWSLSSISNLHRTATLPFVIPRACDFFDLFVFSAYLTGCFSVPSQIRHPERSAAQIYRTTNYLWRGVEGPRRCLLAHAVRSFPTTNYKPNLKSHKLPGSRGICGFAEAARNSGTHMQCRLNFDRVGNAGHALIRLHPIGRFEGIRHHN